MWPLARTVKVTHDSSKIKFRLAQKSLSKLVPHTRFATAKLAVSASKYRIIENYHQTRLLYTMVAALSWAW